MPPNILFIDRLRQDEIETFYEASQMQRDYYRGYAKSRHPLIYFKNSEYKYQCAPPMTDAYLSFPSYHVRYKQPVALPLTYDRTSGFPSLPSRTLAGRTSTAPCFVYKR